MAINLKGIYDKNVAKALIKSAYFKSNVGIMEYLKNYEDDYFDARDDDDVQNFSPCDFVVASVTHNCNCKIDIQAGNIYYKQENIKNLCEFFGYLDEDKNYTIGIIK